MADPTAIGRRAGVLQAVVLLLPATLAVMAVVALAPDLPQLFRVFGAVPGSKILVPMVLTLPALCMIVFGPIAGYCGDRFGRHRLLVASLMTYAAFGMAPLVLSDIGPILITRVGVGISEAFALTLCSTLISDYYVGEARDRWLGYQTAVAAVSAVIFIAVGGLLGGLGWRAPFAIYAAPLLFAVLVGFLTWEPEQPHRQVDASRGVFPWRTMSIVLVITFFASVMFYVAQIQSGVAMDAKGLKSAPMIGLLTALATLATIAGTVAFRFLVRSSPALLLAIGFVSVGAGYLGVRWAPDAIGVAVALAVAQFGCGLLLPTLLTWGARILSFEVRARGMGLWQGVFSIGQFFSPLTVALIAHQNGGGVISAFGVLGLVNLVAAALALIATLYLRSARLSEGAARVSAPT